MVKRWKRELTEIEEQVVADIRYWRQLPAGNPEREQLNDPVTLLHQLIEAKHANVQLHIRNIAEELGIELRTLERRFKAKYGKNLLRHQVDVRIEFACSLLGYFPEERIGAIAEALGYSEVRDFNRFFSDHKHMSPSEWRRRDQLLTKRTMRKLLRESDTSEE